MSSKGADEENHSIFSCLKYNIEFNKQETLTVVPSDGKIIISLFLFPLSLLAHCCWSDEILI